ncbi:MAG: glycosyltransferase family 2 protein [SAR324 cluster bacterium]|nr:glycosyltransferase family 2 protein [SAR324 cluster bacterium]
MKLSIIVPCYNEAQNIPLILKAFGSVIKRDDVEVLLVNNGSTDDSASVMAELTAKTTFARVVNVKVNQGYGFGIYSGLKAATGDFVGWTHADMQTDPRDSIKALEILESKTDPESWYVKGLREGRPWADEFFTAGMSLFETLYLKTNLWDINAQPNIFHKSFLDEMSAPPKDFSFDLYALYLAKQKGLSVERFEVSFPPRIHGESSWNTGFASKWKFIKRTFEFSFKLKKEL